MSLDSFFDSLRGPVSPPQPDYRYRVLVVEDHADPSRIITWLLRGFGFDAKAILDGASALATARSFRPHFILLDIRLPGMDGYQIAEAIRQDAGLKEVVIIAASALGPNANPVRNRQAGFDFHLTKPFEINELLPLLVPRH